MSRTARALYVEATDALLGGLIVAVARRKDRDLLREIARITQDDAPPDLAMTDPARCAALRAAITRFHLAGWTRMTPDRVDQVRRHTESERV